MRIVLQHSGEWLRFENPVEVLTARTTDEVFQCLEKVAASGLWAAGFVSYEAAGAFDDALQTHAPGRCPLLQFGLFENVERAFQPAYSCGEGRQERPPHYQLGEWVPSVTRDEYVRSIAQIKEHIAAGDTYQVNYTFRLNTSFDGDPFGFFCDLVAAQQGGFGAYIETEDLVICSASPELFFEVKDGVITSRPMKGTRPRGRTFFADCQHAEDLQHSGKDRAENIMIVDMIRNDIGRIAATGSIETISKFDVEKYPTVWQMTSTVRGKTASSFSNVWKHLFPCASITGAPKAKTMEMIQGLEKSPRGIYTGSIGWVAPDGEACFNVAIRTAVLDRMSGSMEYGIGGGIVWDSDADAEYDEALSKAAILAKHMPDFQLLETMRWEDGEIFLLERHLKRLAESADYFDFECDVQAIHEHLLGLRLDGATRIRLLVNKNGLFEVQSFVLKRQDASSTVACSKHPVDSGNVFLYHKTTNRAVYEDAKADFPDVDDVLLFNERGEVTESCIANVVVDLDGCKVTPPVSCGLLAGTLRDHLIEAGEIKERVVTRDDLKRADAVWLINSVRKWRPAVVE